MQVSKYIKESISELNKVTWPTREQAVQMTTIVIIASLLIGLYVSGLDFIFTNLLSFFIK